MKYALHPGWIISKKDGDRHYISAGALIRLYKVKPTDCWIWSKEFNHVSIGPSRPHFDKHLFPREDGNYTL
jgi:hypothetical protein